MLKYAALSLFAISSVAMARPNTFDMTCAEAQGLVQANGAVVMNYGYSAAAGHLYERFVAHSGFCAGGDERAEPMWVPAADTDQCALYTCRSRSND